MRLGLGRARGERERREGWGGGGGHFVCLCRVPYLLCSISLGLAFILIACLDMYNNSPPPQPPTPMSPRISFSNDFVESHNNNSHHLLINNNNSNNNTISCPVSTDFEFSVSNHNMSAADELFFKGRLLPFKHNNNSQMQRTLRDELLNGDDDFSLKPPKGSSSSYSNRWKGFLGLRKSHIGSKKPDNKSDASFNAPTMFAFAPHDPNHTKSPQDMVNDEGPSSK